MAGNRNLNSAARAKKDEFYTQLTDIEHELYWYREHFAGKTIFCNCDDPFESQFFFYFAMCFNFLKLKKLIVTSYPNSPIVGDLFNPVDDGKPAYKVEINRIDKDPFDWTDVTALMNELKIALGKNSSATVNENTLSLLEGDGHFCAGDFRSAECVELLKQSDIVVTNPPFSLFREFVAQLVTYDKKFLIIGNQNCITYKEIFPLIMQNKMWLGYGFRRNPRFRIPDYYDGKDSITSDSEGKKWQTFGNVHWFTNLEHDKRNRPYELVFSYKENPARYPHYDNYDAIEVGKTGDIPYDYFGVMGVPITFLDKYCPEQFEIVGKSDMFAGEVVVDGKLKKNPGRFYIIGKRMYDRILIRRREHDD